MGTYTTNYQLYIPTVGETGWGILVNGNFSTIDTTMKGLSNRITAVENEVNGVLNCTSVTTSGTITSSGKITGNGGIGTTSLTTSGNITSSGTISAAKIKQTGAMTVTSTTAETKLGMKSQSALRAMCILPINTHKYTGSINIKNVSGSFLTCYYITEFNTTATSKNISSNGTITISFTNASVLYLFVENLEYVAIGNITLS